MTIFKCKMCGGSLEVAAGVSVMECEYCGTQQTLPKLNDDKRANMYDRANHFRRNNEFDKAMGIYEQILNEDKTDAEAYWSIVLCRFGIEYVEDPASHKRIPTVNRAQFTSVFDDDNYKSALQYADADQRAVYEAEAKTINEIQKGILAISQKEEPFDVFICYKETDNNGRRTPDSVLAQELYYQLKQEELKVFFARITLEDKLGSAYEPYIFAALNSAKVMVVLGTKPEHFNAVWVKNEWSRYLALIKQGQKKVLIPAYRDMDPYDLPEEFSHLQAQDMSKLGFMQDLIRGIRKLTQEDAPAAAATVVKETVVTTTGNSNANPEPLLERAFMFLEDGEWKSADEYCEKVLDIDPKNAQAYLGKMMAQLRVRTKNALKDCEEPFDDSSNYQKALRFSDDNFKAVLVGYIEHINTRNENARLDGIYRQAKSAMDVATTEDAYKEAAGIFKTIRNYLDSSDLEKSCYDNAEIARKDAILAEGITFMNGEDIFNYEFAIKEFKSIPGWKNADEQIRICQEKIEQIKAQQEAERLEKERLAEIARKEAEARAKKNRKIAFIVTSSISFIIAVVLVLNYVVIPTVKYNDAVALMDAGNYTEAIAGFEALDGFKDSANQIDACNIAILDGKYNDAVALMDAGNYTEAIAAFGTLDGYRESVSMIAACHTAILDGKYNDAVALMEAGKYQDAITAFEAIKGHKDSVTKINDCKYDEAVSLMIAGNYEDAITAFEAIKSHKDSDKKIQDCSTAILDGKYDNAIALKDAGKYTEAISAFEALNGYKDSAAQIKNCNTAIIDGKYNDAVALMNAGNLDKAYRIFNELSDYKDSAKKVESIRITKSKEQLKSATIGSYIKFGTYEQDNNTKNGKEDIEWLILAKEGNRVLVISRYALDCQLYNTSKTSVTWETCSLRKWLNGTFINDAFSAGEQAMIPTVTVSADKNPNYSTNPGNATQDKVFLLSITEVDKYFTSNEAGKCLPTEYAIAQGASENRTERLSGKAICWWWLRTPGFDQYSAADFSSGSVNARAGNLLGFSVTMYGGAVRPALWIDLSA